MLNKIFSPGGSHTEHCRGPQYLRARMCTRLEEERSTRPSPRTGTTLQTSSSSAADNRGRGSHRTGAAHVQQGVTNCKAMAGLEGRQAELLPFEDINIAVKQ